MRCKGIYQRLSDHCRGTALEIPSFEQLDEFTVFNKTDRWRRRHIAREIFTCRLGSVDVSAGENSYRAVRFVRRVLQSHRDTWTHAAGRTAANRIDDDHQCSVCVLDGLINGLGRLCFFYPKLCELCPHTLDHDFWIWHKYSSKI